MDLHGLDPQRLNAWLNSLGLAGELTEAQPLSGGTQNLMLRLRVGEQDCVLRHPPLHRRPHSNRSLAREMRVLAALAQTDIPHARLLGGAEESDLLDGATAFVTTFVDGFNPGDDSGPEDYSDPRWRHDATLAAVDGFAQLGALDHTALGLDDLGRPDGFLERQIDLTLRTWDAVRAVSDTPVDVVAACEALRQTRPDPQPPGLTHGDAHLNNVLLHRTAPQLAAVVDLEMITVGDPLLDLGWILACWPTTDRPITGAALHRRGPLPDPAEVAARYAAASGRDVGRVDWYVALASLKLGALLETTYLRSLNGEAPADTGRRLHAFATDLFAAAAALQRGRTL